MSKILIDEAVVRRFVYATAMVVDCAQLEDWQLELYDKAGADLAEALADAALDKMAENARELGLSYEQSQYSDIVSDGGLDPRNKFDTPPVPEPDPDELTIAYMSGVYEGKKRKPWVGLTDEEIIKCWGQVSGTRYGYVAFARAIEAKLKEKNT